jgi:hypothetical protein
MEVKMYALNVAKFRKPVILSVTRHCQNPLELKLLDAWFLSCQIVANSRYLSEVDLDQVGMLVLKLPDSLINNYIISLSRWHQM